jgi:hypothetical protein
MRTTLRNIDQRTTLLFHGWYIHVCPKVAGNKAPTTIEFQYIIEAAGATYISTMKNIDDNDNDGDQCTRDSSKNILLITSDPPTKAQLSHIEKQTKHQSSSDPMMDNSTTIQYYHRTTTWFFHTIMAQEITL